MLLELTDRSASAAIVDDILTVDVPSADCPSDIEKYDVVEGIALGLITFVTKSPTSKKSKDDDD